jgi:NodT family efflux transporter outer membrane factor (OMF) lipoprotein
MGEGGELRQPLGIAIVGGLIAQPGADALHHAGGLSLQATASFFPTLGLTGQATRTGSGGGTSASVVGATVVSSGAVRNQYQLSASASWQPDIWGKIRRTVEADSASAQASAADLAGALLSEQGTLATDYFELRVADATEDLLVDTVKAYQRSYEITQNQYKVGTAAKADVITALTQLQGAQAQRIALGVTRAQLEHAIAVLVGKIPAEFSIAHASLKTDIPVAPTGVPSALLERRPDIAGAERRMAETNAQIGVAIAAYYPDLTLSGSYGVEGTNISHLFSLSNTAWSLGSELTETVFDAGARSAQVDQARATFDQGVATYRQTVLAAFQGVEDNLAGLRILELEAAVQEETVKSAQEAVRLTLNEYKAGTVAYTAVVTAQATALGDEQTLLTIRQSRLTDSVALIEALGGGWSADQLPSRGEFDVAKTADDTKTADAVK